MPLLSLVVAVDGLPLWFCFQGGVLFDPSNFPRVYLALLLPWSMIAEAVTARAMIIVQHPVNLVPA
jgi:hypothetical protein